MIIYYILLLHLIADFIFQNRWMAENKSKNIFALSLHVLVYGVVFVVLLVPFFNFLDVLIFVCVNIGLHWATDFTTSRITSYFWNKKQIYNFFLTIGVDQYIHQACLISTLHFLGA